jgi:hypothetical protein
MANEVTLTAGLSVTKDGTTLQGYVNKQITMSGTPKISNTQTIGTTTEQLVLGDIASMGYLYLKNLDSTNFVEIGLSTPVSGANAMIKLLPGEAAIIPTRQTTIYAKADTAAVALEVVACSL